MKFNILGIFQSLKVRILKEKILPIPLKLNFTPNTLGSYGLNLSTKEKIAPYLRELSSPSRSHSETDSACT